MREVETEVRAVRVELMCSVLECDGVMEVIPGAALMSYPPQLPHRCSVCGGMCNVCGEMYPRIEYKIQEVS